MLRLLSAVLATVLVLTGCNQDTTTQTNDSGPAMESPDVTSKDFGDYVLHFNAISTDQLQPEIARTYNIVRSKNRAMLNVSIIKKVEGTTGKPVTGDITVTVNNLTGQVKNLTLKEVRESGAIYYIGDAQVANGETLIFNLKVKPEDKANGFAVRFSRPFFSD